MGQVRAWNLDDLPQHGTRHTLDPDDLSTTIDNPYLPLRPRARWVYRETGAARGDSTIVVTVTTMTRKLANGVIAVVVRDTVTEGGDVVEDSFDLYAQDSAGTVWYLGEDSAEFEDGELVSRDGSFEGGVSGAMAGVAMPASPRNGLRYRQEYAQGEAEDSGRILHTTLTANVAAGRFEDVVLTQDTTALQPHVLEHKLYAPGVGNVLTVAGSEGDGREELVRKSTVSRRDARSAGVMPLGQPYD
jgi:hypothetical protein